MHNGLSALLTVQLRELKYGKPKPTKIQDLCWHSKVQEGEEGDANDKEGQYHWNEKVSGVMMS